MYGRPESLPVTESHLVRPTDVNGINKAAGEYDHLVYNNVFGIRGCSLRLTNVYGPRQLIKHNRQGFIGWFIRLAIENKSIQMFVVRTRDRSRLQASLAARGIDTLVHYPIPIPRQPAFAAFAPAECPVAARVCNEVVSLPLHPRMTNDDVAAVAAAVLKGH